MYKKIFKEIKKYDTIVISRHIGPDPDALSSQIALRDSIKLTFPEKKVYAVGTGSAKFSFIGHLDKMEDVDDALLITCDTPDLKRVDIPDIYKKTMCTKTRANFELTKKVMDRMELLEYGKVAFTYINSQDEEEAGAEPGDQEGLVDIGRNIEGVEVSVFIRQKENENAYKASLRSGDEINVSDICLMFGGGGHQRAAGALIQGNVEQVKEKIMKEVSKALK